MSSRTKATAWWVGAITLIGIIAYTAILWLTTRDPFYAAGSDNVLLGLTDIGRTDVLTAVILAAWLAGTAAFLSRGGSTLWLLALLSIYLVPPLFDKLANTQNIRPPTLVPWTAIGHSLELGLTGVNNLAWVGAALELFILLAPGFANLGVSRFGFTQLIAVTILTGVFVFAAQYLAKTIFSEQEIANTAFSYVAFAGFAGTSSGNKWPFVGFAALYAFALFASPVIVGFILVTAAVGHATRSLSN